MKRIDSILKLALGATALFVAYQFWFGQGLFNGWFAPSVESGQLGASGADIIVSLLELVATVVSGIGGLILFITTPLYVKLSTMVYNALNGDAEDLPLDDKADIQFMNQRGTPSLGHPTLGHMSDAMRDDMIRLLLQSIVEGDKSMTISLCERLHGTNYLIRTKRVVSTTDEHGFPREGR